MKNVGGIDRALRIIIGLCGIGLSAYLYLNPTLALIPATMLQLLPQATWMIVIGAIGAVMLFTGLVGFCLLYVPFGLSSCAVKAANKK
jgi:Protein of unknown function (DUF2892)